MLQNNSHGCFMLLSRGIRVWRPPENFEDRWGMCKSYAGKNGNTIQKPADMTILFDSGAFGRPLLLDIVGVAPQLQASSMYISLPLALLNTSQYCKWRNCMNLTNYMGDHEIGSAISTLAFGGVQRLPEECMTKFKNSNYKAILAAHCSCGSVISC